jgi:hypothetical protein
MAGQSLAGNPTCCCPKVGSVRRELVKRTLTYPERSLVKRNSTNLRSNRSNAHRHVGSDDWSNATQPCQSVVARIIRHRPVLKMAFGTGAEEGVSKHRRGKAELQPIPPLSTTESRHLRRSPIAAGKVYATIHPRRRRAVPMPRFGQDVVGPQALGSNARVANRSARKPETGRNGVCEDLSSRQRPSRVQRAHWPDME